MFSIIRNTAQPHRQPDSIHPEQSETIWQTVLDQTRMRYIFESTTRPNIVWVDFAKMDFSEASDIQKLDLLSDLAIERGIAGDVSAQFRDTGGVSTFTAEEGLRAMQYLADHQGDTDDIRRMISAHTPSAENTQDPAG